MIPRSLIWLIGAVSIAAAAHIALNALRSPGAEAGEPEAPHWSDDERALCRPPHACIALTAYDSEGARTTALWAVYPGPDAQVPNPTAWPKRYTGDHILLVAQPPTQIRVTAQGHAGTWETLITTTLRPGRLLRIPANLTPTQQLTAP